MKLKGVQVLSQGSLVANAICVGLVSYLHIGRNFNVVSEDTPVNSIVSRVNSGGSSSSSSSSNSIHLP